MGKTKKDTNARVAGELRKEIKESAAEQLCMDNTSVGLNESNDSLLSDIYRSLCQHPCYCFQISKFSQNHPFSRTSIFLPTLNDSHSFIRVANFRFFTH